MAKWLSNDGIWMGSTTGARLKACIHCQDKYAPAFYAPTKTQSTISWAGEFNERTMYLTNARGRLFDIGGGNYWGALVCACHEQEM